MKDLFDQLEKAGIKLELIQGNLKLSAEKGLITSELLAKIKANKEAIIAELEACSGAADAVLEREGETFFELSVFQREIWINSALYQTGVYNQVRSFLLEGDLNLEALEAAAFDLMDRYEILRTTFHLVDGEPFQRINPVDGLFPGSVLERDDLRELQTPKEAALHRIKSISSDEMDFENGPLIRFLLFRIDVNSYVFALVHHHIIMDGWSSEIAANYLMSRYMLRLEGDPAPAARPAFQYKDFSARLNRELKQGLHQAQRAFWREYLAGELPVLHFPTDFQRPAVRTFNGEHAEITMDPAVSAAIKSYCRENNVTPFLFFHSLVSVLLYRYTGQTDLITGSAFAGRGRPELEDQLGTFANILPIRTQIDKNETFSDLLNRVKNNILQVYDNQFYPFSNILEDIGYVFDQSHAPLFDVAVAAQNFSQSAASINGFKNLIATPLDAEETVAARDLGFVIGEGPDGKIGISILYNTDLFKRSRIEALARHLLRLATAAVNQADTEISRLPMLSEKEAFGLLRVFNDTSIGPPPYDTILDLFRETVMKYPAAIALAWNDTRLTYCELDRESDQFAAVLRRQFNLQPGDFAAVMAGRNHHTIIAMLAVMKAGGVFMPIEEDTPEQRVQEVCHIAKPSLFLSVAELAGRIPASAGLPVLLMDNPVDAPAEDPQEKTHRVKAGDPAYIIFTSGSTGQPKPIVAKHEGLINNVWDYIPKLGAGPEDNYLQFFSLGFDGFFFDIFPLLCGATLVMADKNTVEDRDQFLAYLESHRITMTGMTPSYLEMLNRPDFPGLRGLISAGEAADPAAARQYGSRLSFFNLYGPAEATVIATFYRVDPAELVPGQPVPIGKPCANKKIYVLDDELNLLPKGVPGELCISGAGIVDGYLNNPGLTAEKFLPDPFEPGLLLYRTGDLAQWTEDGNLLFLGRKDSQIKVNGYRIELGEIEKKILDHPSVARAAVRAVKKERGAEMIGFYQRAGEIQLGGPAGEDPFANELRHFLFRRIPGYMIPGKLIEVDEWPLTPQGKIDGSELLRLAARYRNQPQIAEPLTPMQENIRGIWAEILKKTEIGIHDFFFETGGDSLSAIRVVSAIKSRLKLELKVKDIFNHPTIAQLADFLEKKSDEIPPPEISAGPRPDRIPLSFAQERLWFIDQLGGSLEYHMPSVIRLTGDLNPNMLEAALRGLVGRHEVLRTVFTAEDGRPFQVVMPASDWKLTFSRNQNAEDQDSLQDLIAETVTRPFDLSADYMLRAHLAECGPHDHVLILVVHHIASDGWSQSLLVRDLAALYAAFSAAKEPELQPLPVQYADYAVWQRRYLDQARLSRDLDWWSANLAGVEPLKLPADFPRPAVQGTRGKKLELEIGSELTDGLRKLSRSSGTTLFMTLLAAYKVLLYRYSGQADLCVGTPVANRQDPLLESLAGFFVNTLALRSDLSGNPPFRQVLKQIRTTVLSAFERQETPFEQVVDRVEQRRDLSRNPVFQVEFVLQNLPEIADLNLRGLTIAQEFDVHVAAQFEVSLSVIEKPEKLILGFIYNSDLFTESRMDRFAGHFRELLTGLVADPDIRIGECPMLTAEEEREILVAFNDTAKAYPADKTIIDLVFEQVKRTPEKTAVTCAGEALSYSELVSRAGQLAGYLRAQAIGKEEIIPVCMDRSPEMLIGILGIFMAGGAYLPVDPEYPDQRIGYILEDSGARLMLTDGKNHGRLKGITAAKSILPQDWLNCVAPASRADVHPDDLAYVIYTSGSTGNPKGAMIEHRGMVNHLYAKINELGITSTSRVLQNASQAFDISIWQFLVALAAGGTTVIYPQEIVLDADRFLTGLAMDRLTHAEVVPSYLRLLLDMEKIRESRFPDLEYLLVTGETLPKPLLAQWLSQFPEIPVVNAYGPTEASDDITHCFLSALPVGEFVPIGHVLQNLRILILNPFGELCPVGVPGEICVTGTGVGRGYLNQPVLTARKFVNDPLNPGETMYKTGDLGYWQENGELIFIGRIDNQVKIRGHRIELEEIEAVVRKCPGVRETAVITFLNDNNSAALAGYIVLDGTASRDDLQHWIAQQLPDYMTPSVWIELDRMPLTPNGKLDRKGLPAPEAGDAGREQYVPPGNKTEKDLTDIWSALLKQERIGIHDNFFEKGGDSIISIQLVSRARQSGYAIQPRDVFLYQTVATLAERISTRSSEAVIAEQGLLNGPAELLPIQQRFFQYGDQPLSHYNQSVLTGLDKSVAATDLEKIAGVLIQQHDALRFRYYLENGQWRQEYGDSPGLLEIVRLDTVPPESVSAEITKACNRLQASLDICKGPIIRFCLILTPSEYDHNRLFITIHHLAADGISWRILFEDLEKHLTALSLGQPISLEKKGTSYRQWATALAKHAEDRRTTTQLAFWQSVIRDYQPIPADRQTGGCRYGDLETWAFDLPAALTRSLLQEANQAYGTAINDLLVSALVSALGNWSGLTTVVIGLEGHGRESLADNIDISRTIGWFTTLYPAAFSYDPAAGEDTLIKTVKEQLRGIPDKGLGFGLLRYLHPSEKIRCELALAKWDIEFNYLGQTDNATAPGNWFSDVPESKGEGISPEAPIEEKLLINAFVAEGRLRLSLNYSKNQYKLATIDRLGQHFVNALERIAYHCLDQNRTAITPSDLGLGNQMDHRELDELNDFLIQAENNGDEILRF